MYQEILILCDEAYSKKIEFDNVEIATDSESISDTDILNYIKSNSKNKIDYLVHVSYEKELNENSVFREENTKIKNYTVTFNSDGGTVIDTQKVEEGKKVTRPTNPTKVGYNFVEWRFNGKAFNFDTAVTQDITLEAVWEKIKATENNRTTNQNVVSQNVQEPEKNVDEGVQPSPDPPVEETPTVPEETPVVPEATPENQQPVE